MFHGETHFWLLISNYQKNLYILLFTTCCLKDDWCFPLTIRWKNFFQINSTARLVEMKPNYKKYGQSISWEKTLMTPDEGADILNIWKKLVSNCPSGTMGPKFQSLVFTQYTLFDPTKYRKYFNMETVVLGCGLGCRRQKLSIPGMCGRVWHCMPGNSQPTRVKF